MERLTESKLHGCSGTVYDGSTGSPMASVAVSNGREVVLTDEAGRYALSGWDKAGFITVTAPAGYWAWDYYIPISHRETGYDFALDKLERDLTNHTFLQVTDSEVGADGAGAWVEKLRRTAEETRPAFIIHTGDICYIDGLKTHMKDMNSENMGVPVRYVIGNHDYVNWGDYGEALFESIYGPVMYSFDVGRIHYIVTPIVHGDVRAKYTESDVIAFVKNDLQYVAEDRKVIIFNHNYCWSDEIGFVLSDGEREIDLKKHNLLAWVFGHWHFNYLNEIGGIFNITTSRPDTGGIDASPATIRSVTIEGDALQESLCRCGDDAQAAAPEEAYGWSVSLGGSVLYSAPAAAEGMIFAGTTDDGWPKNCGIAALSQETGQLLWTYKTKNSVKSDILVINDKIITQDTEGNVCCLDFSGKEIWTAETQLLAPNNSSSSIAADENYVYCGGQQHVYCLKSSDGSRVWDRRLSGENTSPSGFVLYEKMLFVGAHWDKLYALDAATGEILWTNKSEKFSYYVMTPGLYEGCLFTGSWNTLCKIDARSGKTVKCREMEGYTFNSASTPYIEKGILYTGTTDRGVIAVDTETLEVLWTFETGKNLIATSPYSTDDAGTVDSAVIPSGEYLCFGASDGRIYLIDKNGKKVADYPVGASVNQAPIVDGGFIAAADFSGKVTCICRR